MRYAILAILTVCALWKPAYSGSRMGEFCYNPQTLHAVPSLSLFKKKLIGLKNYPRNTRIPGFVSSLLLFSKGLNETNWRSNPDILEYLSALHKAMVIAKVGQLQNKPHCVEAPSPIDLTLIKRLTPGLKDCFKKTYRYLRRVDLLEYGPLRACIESNEICGTETACHGCGPDSDPLSEIQLTAQLNPIEFKNQIAKKGNEFLHSKRCGGTTRGADKIAHCWAFCSFDQYIKKGASAATLPLIPLGGSIPGLAAQAIVQKASASYTIKHERQAESDLEDVVADQAGISCSADSDPGNCFNCCVQRTYTMHFN